MKADIHRLLELQKLLVQFSQVERRDHRKHNDRFIAENDTEHSYNLAMTAWFLAQWFPELNKDLIIRYALVHDLVEVHAGDTFTYGSEAELASKDQREQDALLRLEQDWGDFSDMTKSINAYETKSDAESRFIYALDKVMPIMMIYIHDGYSWNIDKVTVKMLYDAKIAKIKLSPEIIPYFDQLHELLLSRPDLINKS
ncbi:MAG TPA: HD domain-containing protein [Candidatus Microsaccharimonas sp.]|jgi:putative hydrolase of HD superfamily